MQLLINLFIYAGSALMIANIVRYYGFTKRMAWMKQAGKNNLVLYTPLVLLILFLFGYIGIALIGRPNMLMAGILLGGSVFVMIILNILYYIVDKVAENERLEQELNQARKASKAKTFFLSNMSHDIRTPMNAIISYTELAKKEENSREQVDEYLTKISSAGSHMLSLINDVLEMSRIENGKIELSPGITDLTACIRGIYDLFHAQMEQKQIAFSTEYQNVSHPHVLCDKNRFNRVLLNLVSNAYKFTDQGGSVLITLCETDFADCQASYEIRVKDSGIGMTEEFAGKVFEAFERERTSTVSGIEGTGLGMAISKSIIEQMGGTIDVDTTPGIGTEFIIRVSFPVASGPCKEINVPEADKTPVPEVDFSGKRLLLAEDNPVNCDTVMMQQEKSELLQIPDFPKFRLLRSRQTHSLKTFRPKRMPA